MYTLWNSLPRRMEAVGPWQRPTPWCAEGICNSAGQYLAAVEEFG